MFCCMGLFAGYAVGASLGGPWTLIGPGLGFGLGLMADMRVMRRSRARRVPEVLNHAKPEPNPATTLPIRMSEDALAFVKKSGRLLIIDQAAANPAACCGGDLAHHQILARLATAVPDPSNYVKVESTNGVLIYVHKALSGDLSSLKQPLIVSRRRFLFINGLSVSSPPLETESRIIGHQ